ncbi:MAG: nucleoside kinase [Anaerolineales bacterium]|nr:nucleoside kinase [Anaerolineales bacterium]
MANTTQRPIREVSASENVQIFLPDERVLEGPRGTQLSVFLADESQQPAPIVGGIVNGELRELMVPINMDAQVRPVRMDEADGMRIYRRSLTFVLAAAFEKLFPDATLTVDHSVSSGGYYCEVHGREPLSPAELAHLTDAIQEIVDADMPFSKSQMLVADAIQYFRSKGHEDKALLLTHRKKATLVMYQLGSYRDYHHGYMVPSSGYLRWFALASANSGFTLQFPRRHRPVELLGPPQYPKLLATFRQYGKWLSTLGVRDVGTLNDAIVHGRTRELVLVSEALHEGRISDIARTIAERQDSVRIVLIAGPSSSGKTTFSKRLSIQLLARGISPFPIPMDNFFVDRSATPRDEEGEYDYESIHALDLDRLDQNLRGLMAGKEVTLPHYNFKTGLQEEGRTIRLSQDHVILLEGIHGLNPELLKTISHDRTFRIYLSALTQLNLDHLNRVSTTDTRLLRRIVRDARYRGYSASETIRRWESVRRGEKRYIFPYQENADVMFNSALVYEGSALAPLAEPLIRQVPFGTVEHVEAKRLLAFLEWFIPIDKTLIPDNSILREFIGGSSLREYEPWHSPQSAA